GLLLALEAGVSNVICEIDSLEVFVLLNNISSADSIIDKDIVQKIKDCLLWNWDVQFRLIKREANNAADWIAKKGATSESSFSIWIEPGNFLQQILLDDAMAVP
ncbi:hypothetical protein PIB30_108778, partial [Stylosanthes scabra]|nr:hypothetical protein [Stylosanthes scabra]MED6178562.1 hypothetical protein [Stylosanthes scabra]